MHKKLKYICSDCGCVPAEPSLLAASPDALAPTAAQTMHLTGLSPGKLSEDPPAPHRSLAALRSVHTAQSTLVLCWTAADISRERLVSYQCVGWKYTPDHGAFLVYDTQFNLSFCWKLISLSAWLFARETYDPSNFKISIVLLNLSSHLVQKLWEKRE